MEKLFRIAYCSHNRIPDAQLTEELHKILEASRRNNTRLQVTGALLYNQGSFAQVLEGPLAAIERIFENIQCDPRHSDVMVIESGPVTHRSFPHWSMAFAGDCHLREIPAATEAFASIYGGAPEASREILTMLEQLVIEEGEWATLLDRAPQMA